MAKRAPMRIESLSIKTVTVAIFVMIGIVASILSLLAGNYFRQAALDAQVSSLSRVIEVASQEMLRAVRGHTFDLGMRLAHSEEMIRAMREAGQPGGRAHLVQILDDPFINGFVGFANINLEKIRIYDLDLHLVAESTRGITGLESQLAAPLVKSLSHRRGVERLKAVDAIWISHKGPLHSTIVPIGGLHLHGYLEIIINPVFNLPDIGAITRTPISISTPAGKPILASARPATGSLLPVEYILPASDGTPAFRIVGYEDVAKLDATMEKTRLVTISGFLVLTFVTLLGALWLFNRFLFVPVRRMVQDMQRMAAGKLDLTVDNTGLREFTRLADTFNVMAEQVRQRTSDLERLLNLDDSAILCFGSDQEAVYLNRGAATLFGYAPAEITDLDMADLFDEDLVARVREAGLDATPSGGSLQARLACRHKDGSRFERESVIRPIHVRGGHGFAVVLSVPGPTGSRLSAEEVISGFQRNEQRMNAVEESLNSLLELARGAPGFQPSPGTDLHATGDTESAVEPPALREQAVNVMLCALACWEHDLDKSKIDLAEESGIWPVYIDKSTPTTRTLDKYLNIETCPRNPRSQRVIDTAEFVLKQLGRKSTAERRKLQQALNDFRFFLSGIRFPGN